MFNLGPAELIIILVLALIIFGPGKLPEVGKAIGRAFREFRQAAQEVKQELEESPTKEEEKIENTNEERPEEKS